MINNQNNNSYTEKLKNHPIFRDNEIRSDFEVKKMFQNTFQIYKSILEGEICDKLECYEESNVCNESTNGTKEENNCHKTGKKENVSYHEKNYEEGHCSKKKEIVTESEENYESDDEDDEIDFDISTEYSLLFLIIRLNKIFEHILLKKYIFENDKNESFTVNTIDFDAVINFCKKNKIITSEEEENSIYLLQLLSNAVEENFLFKPSDAIELSLLTNDKYMLCDVDHSYLLETLENINKIINII